MKACLSGRNESRTLATKGIWTAVLGVALLIAACSEAPDPDGIAGIYKIDRRTRNENRCSEGQAVSGPSHVRLIRGSMDGESCYSTSECSSADPGSCKDASRCRLKKDGDSWVMKASAVSGQTPPCLLQYFEERLTKLPDNRMHIEARSYHFKSESVEVACDTNEALKRGSSMPCVAYSLKEGTRVN